MRILGLHITRRDPETAWCDGYLAAARETTPARPTAATGRPRLAAVNGQLVTGGAR